MDKLGSFYELSLFSKHWNISYANYENGPKGTLEFHCLILKVYFTVFIVLLTAADIKHTKTLTLIQNKKASISTPWFLRKWLFAFFSSWKWLIIKKYAARLSTRWTTMMCSLSLVYDQHMAIWVGFLFASLTRACLFEVAFSFQTGQRKSMLASKCVDK